MLPGFEISELLNRARGPGNADFFRRFVCAQAEEEPLAVLRQKRRTGTEPFRLTVHFNLGADSVAIRFGAAQFNRDGVPSRGAIVLQHANLRAQAALQNQIGSNRRRRNR